MATIYDRPDVYDLEHEGDDQDIAFFIRFAERVRARRVLELGCGSGRVTVPLAEYAARNGATLVGLDESDAMLAQAARKLEAASPEAKPAASLVTGDMRTYDATARFDLILVPCGTLSHLLDLDEQLAVWRRAYDNLAPGGRFVVDVPMPNLSALAESLATPPRALVELDLDAEAEGGSRLLRYKTTLYEAHTQRARVRFLYDHFDHEPAAERLISDFESHTYFPRELELLFRATGFRIEATYGDYGFRPLRARSRTMIMVGARPA
jgi:SAM-dependent methyltransferase